MLSSKTGIHYYAPRFQLEIENSAVSDEAACSISSVKVELELNKPKSFTFELQDQFDGSGFKWLGHSQFKFGNLAKISMGYTGNILTMVEGKIQNIAANFSQGNAPTISIEGADRGYEFLKAPCGTKVFEQKTDSEIVKEVAGIVNLSAKVDDTQQENRRKTKKGGKSYYEFLQDLAATNGFEFYVYDKTLHFVKKNYGETVANLVWGEDLISFQPRLNTAQALTEVIVRGWDASGKRVIEGTARAGDEERQEHGKSSASTIASQIYGDVVKVITDRPIRSVAEAQNIARVELDNASDNFIRASVETIGIPELRPGVCVEIDGFGDWFSGKYYIEKVSHSYDDSGYRSSFEVRRNAI